MITDQDRLNWLKSNPTKGYQDLPQQLWDENRVSYEVARQQGMTQYPGFLQSQTPSAQTNVGNYFGPPPAFWLNIK